MPAEVVQLRDGAPALTDIPGMFRRLADKIEAGEHGEVRSAFVLLPSQNDYPSVFGYGDVERSNDPIIQFELAKHWLLTNMVARA